MPRHVGFFYLENEIKKNTFMRCFRNYELSDAVLSTAIIFKVFIPAGNSQST